MQELGKIYVINVNFKYYIPFAKFLFPTFNCCFVFNSVKRNGKIKRMTSQQQHLDTEQMARLTVYKAASCEHAEGKQWYHRLMVLNACAGCGCTFVRMYLVCRWDALNGHIGSADSV